MVEAYSFGYWVMRRRKALDLTRGELARRIGCATETIKKIERDERRPSRQVAELLADALAVAPEERPLFLQVARGERSVDRLLMAPPLLQPLAEQTHNLPAYATSFIGRENELATIDKLLSDPDCRLLTLLGPGGIGKTRLALRAAERKVGAFPNGAWFVSLAPLQSAEHMIPAIASAIRLNISESRDPKTQLLSYLHSKELLLVLDNFEHLIDGVALIAEILKDAPDVQILVTSRERLNLQGEFSFNIQGLTFPIHGDPSVKGGYSAIQLFLERVCRVQPQIALSEADFAAITHICQFVDGMPLAIELAAAWTRLLSCQEIAREIEQSMDILVASTRDIPERHSSMRAVFDHSWKFLSEEEQTVLRQLSVFRGGFTREAAQQISRASLNILSMLIDKSMLQFDQKVHGVQRYDLHEHIRQYAHERLVERGEEEGIQLREAHLDYFVGLAEQAELELHGPDSLIWLERLDGDYDNLRAAFAWATGPGRRGSGEKAQRLVRALASFWHLRGMVEEGCHWAERALSQDSPSEPIRAKALWVSGFVNLMHGNRDLGCEQLEQAVVLCRRLGSPCKLDLAFALNFIGLEDSRLGDLDSAQVHTEESLAIRRELGDSWGITQSLNNLAAIAQKRGDFARARSFLEEGLSVARELGERGRVALLLNNLGWLIARQGDVIRARSLFHQSLEICHDLKWHWMAADVFENLALIGAWQAGSDQLTKATRLWGVAEMLFKTCGAKYRMEDSAQEISSARNQLGQGPFSKAWEEGKMMTFDQAVAYAFED